MKKLTGILLLVLFLFSSCSSFFYIPEDRNYFSSSKKCSRNIYALGVKDSYELEKFFMANNPKADEKKVRRLAGYYVTEARLEGINSDIAFVQMCLETGFLRFGGLVKPWMHNYCGLGSTGRGNPGDRFPSEVIGVRAHIQHLHAYATTKDKKLKKKLVDKRYSYVQPRGKASTIWKLAGTWSVDRNYGKKLDSLLNQLEKY